MKLTDEVKKKLMDFDFRFAEHIEGHIWRIRGAREIWDNPQKPHVLDDSHMCFYHVGCEDHACCIALKDVLILD